MTGTAGGQYILRSMTVNWVLTDKTWKKNWCSLTKRGKKFGGAVHFLYIHA